MLKNNWTIQYWRKSVSEERNYVYEKYCFYKVFSGYMGSSRRGIKANVLDGNIIIDKLQSRYYIHFQTIKKALTSLSLKLVVK